MKKLAIALLATSALIGAASAQTVTWQPGYVSPNSWADIGNGPAEVMMIEGGAALYTAQGSGIGSTSGSSTSITLTATPSVAPCVGCLLSNSSVPSLTTVTIPAGAYVAAYNGATSITMSTPVTIGAGAPLAWGAACPTSGAPNTTSGLGAPINARAAAGAVGTGIPLYTQSRICAYGGYQPATYVNFAIGAH